MIDGWDILWGGVVPAVVAALVLASVWRATGKAASAWRTALVVGYIAGHWALDARSVGFVSAAAKFSQPVEARDWLPLLLLLAIVPDALACMGKFGPALGGLLRAALCAFVPWRLLYGSSYLPLSLQDLGFDSSFDLGGWSTGEAAAWIGGIGAALLTSWLGSRVDEQREGARLRSVLAVVAALVGAVTVALSASLVYAQLLGVLTASLAGCGLASAFLSTGRGPAAAAGPVVVAFGSLLMAGHFYAELRISNAILLLVAMVLAIGWLPQPAKLTLRRQAVCRTIVCLAILGIAVTLAGLDFTADQTETENNPYHTGSEHW